MNVERGTLWFRTAGVVVRLDGCGGDLAHFVVGAGGGMVGRPEAHPSVCLRISSSDEGRAQLGGALLDPDPMRAAATVLAAVDRAALTKSPSLCLHAAAVSGPRDAVILPGRSGSGKSTLTGACLQAGLSLLSDEAACLTPDLRLVPHRRPLGLSRHSRSLLGLESLDDTEDEVAAAPNLLETVPLSQSTVPVALVALLDRRSGEAPGLNFARRTEVLAELMANRLGFDSEPTWSVEQAWSTLTRLSSGVETAKLTFDSPQEGAAVLVDRLGGDASHVLSP